MPKYSVVSGISNIYGVSSVVVIDWLLLPFIIPFVIVTVFAGYITFSYLIEVVNEIILLLSPSSPKYNVGIPSNDKSAE
jgi:hypothetical protein